MGFRITKYSGNPFVHTYDNFNSRTDGITKYVFTNIKYWRDRKSSSTISWKVDDGDGGGRDGKHRSQLCNFK